MDPAGHKRLPGAACRLCFCCLFVGEYTADELASAPWRVPVANVPYAHARSYSNFRSHHHHHHRSTSSSAAAANEFAVIRLPPSPGILVVIARAIFHLLFCGIFARCSLRSNLYMYRVDQRMILCSCACFCQRCLVYSYITAGSPKLKYPSSKFAISWQPFGILP